MLVNIVCPGMGAGKSLPAKQGACTPYQGFLRDKAFCHQTLHAEVYRVPCLIASLVNGSNAMAAV